eukprot:scaffold15379_cov133-Isochrysis_galbana.AAC.5
MPARLCSPGEQKLWVARQRKCERRGAALLASKQKQLRQGVLPHAAAILGGPTQHCLTQVSFLKREPLSARCDVILTVAASLPAATAPSRRCDGGPVAVPVCPQPCVGRPPRSQVVAQRDEFTTEMLTETREEAL